MSSPSRFTEKLQEALGRAQNAALSAHNQAVDVEHLLAALLEDDEGLVSSVLKLGGVDPRLHHGTLNAMFLPAVVRFNAKAESVLFGQRFELVAHGVGEFSAIDIERRPAHGRHHREGEPDRR